MFAFTNPHVRTDQNVSVSEGCANHVALMAPGVDTSNSRVFCVNTHTEYMRVCTRCYLSLSLSHTHTHTRIHTHAHSLSLSFICVQDVDLLKAATHLVKILPLP